MNATPFLSVELILDTSDQKLPSFTSIILLDSFDNKEEIVNIDGGALSIGHPLGASGARIACKAASILSREGGKKALASMCIGGGMGISIAMESL